jgi:hypothetical protein
MKQETTTNLQGCILAEDFEMPICNIDLQETIEQAIEYFYVMPLCRKETRDFKRKVNELIDTYNDRRGMKIYNHI